MTLKSPDILKRFGAWVIKLINQIGNHLYTYIFAVTITAGILSAATGLILHAGAQKLFIKLYDQRATEIRNEITNIVEDEDLSYYQAVEQIDITKYNKENVRLMADRTESELDDYDRIDLSYEEIEYNFDIQFSDIKGNIFIRPMIGLLIPSYCEVVIVVLSIALFMFLLFLYIRKPISYIEEIDRSIDIIAGGKLSYKIPIKGKDELSRLAENINEMSALLENRIEAEKKSDFKQRQLITNISHDIRTPLTVLNGYLDILRNHHYINQEEADDFVNCSFEKCKQLQQLIEALFTYTKQTSEEITIHTEKVDMIHFVKQSISQQVVKINLITQEKEAMAVIDRNLMNRILDNLFDNIRKYGKRQEIAVVNIRKEANKVILIIENSTDQDLKYKVDMIFERMFIGNESRGENSSGLGLAIVAESVRLIKGIIYARFQKPVLQIILELEEAKG